MRIDLRSLFGIALVAALIAAPLSVYAQKTKSTLTTEVGTNFPNNNVGAITPAIASATFNDFIASWQQAPQVRANTTDLGYDHGGRLRLACHGKRMRPRSRSHCRRRTVPMRRSPIINRISILSKKGERLVSISLGNQSLTVTSIKRKWRVNLESPYNSSYSIQAYYEIIRPIRTATSLPRRRRMFSTIRYQRSRTMSSTSATTSP